MGLYDEGVRWRTGVELRRGMGEAGGGEGRKKEKKKRGEGGLTLSQTPFFFF